MSASQAEEAGSIPVSCSTSEKPRSHAACEVFFFCTVFPVFPPPVAKCHAMVTLLFLETSHKQQACGWFCLLLAWSRRLWSERITSGCHSRLRHILRPNHVRFRSMAAPCHFQAAQTVRQANCQPSTIIRLFVTPSLLSIDILAHFSSFLL